MHPGQKLRPGAHEVLFDGVPHDPRPRARAPAFTGDRVVGRRTADGISRRRRRRRDRATCRCHRHTSGARRSSRRFASATRPSAIARARHGPGGRAEQRRAPSSSRTAARLTLARPRHRRRGHHAAYRLRGTVQPVRVERVEDHRLEARSGARKSSEAAAADRSITAHRRWPPRSSPSGRPRREDALEAVAQRHDGGARARARGGRISSSIRASSSASIGRLADELSPPRSSLLMLVAAFAGWDHVLAAYRDSRRRAIPLLQLRRCHADPVSRGAKPCRAVHLRLARMT